MKLDSSRKREPPISIAEKFWAIARSKAVTLAEGQEIELEAILESLEIEARCSPSAILVKLTARREIRELSFPWQLGIAIAPRLDAIEQLVLSELDRPALLVLNRDHTLPAIVMVISHGTVQPAKATRVLPLDL